MIKTTYNYEILVTGVRRLWSEMVELGILGLHSVYSRNDAISKYIKGNIIEAASLSFGEECYE